MRITVLRQYAKGSAGHHHDQEETGEIDRALRRIKGYLWHGNILAALHCIDDLVMDLECIETLYLNFKAFRKGVYDFQTYIANNAHTIPNYAERHRYGEQLSTAFVAKRFSKQQQMRCSKSGGHLLLQTRTHVLNCKLRTKFQSWYPGLFNTAFSNQAMELKAA